MILLDSFKDKCHLAQALQTPVSLNKGTGSPALSVCSNAHQVPSECLAKHPRQQIHHVLLSAAVDAVDVFVHVGVEEVTIFSQRSAVKKQKNKKNFASSFSTHTINYHFPCILVWPNQILLSWTTTK